MHLCRFIAQHCSEETHITECIPVRPTCVAAGYLGGCSLQCVHQRSVHAGPVQQMGVLAGPAAARPSPTGQPHCQHSSSTPPLPCSAAQWVTASATKEQSVIAVCRASEHAPSLVRHTELQRWHSRASCSCRGAALSGAGHAPHVQNGTLTGSHIQTHCRDMRAGA